MFGRKMVKLYEFASTAGMPVVAMTPDRFAEWLAEVMA